MVHRHPESARRAALRHDPAAPVITFYDLGTGDRVELSAATLDNWVAKVANLLHFEYGVGAGDTVALDLPLHWQVPVFAFATWGLGASIVLGEHSSGTADVVLTTADGTAPEAAAQVLAVSLHPLGLPLGGDCPPWADDALASVRGQADSASLVSPDPEAVVIEVPGRRLTAEQAMSLVRIPAGASRVMVTGDPEDPTGLLDATVGPVLAPAGGVLATGGDPARLAELQSEEKVDATLLSRDAHS